jgi:hypothetical protein
MESNRFDSLVRALPQKESRRGVVLGLVGGVLGGLGVRESSAKHHGNGGNGGKGKGKEKGCGKGQRQCGKGCIPTSQCCPFTLGGTEECDPCTRQVCQEGVCACSPDFIVQNGVCGAFLNCLSTAELRTSSSDCCSEQCVDVGNGQSWCMPGTEDCITDFDCVSGPCRGFLCLELYRSLTGGAC